MKLAYALIAILSACTADSYSTTSSAVTGERIPIVFDHDGDFDDIAALAYLCQAHKQGLVDLRAVTVTNNGAGLPGAAIHNTRCVLEAAGLTNIPVADNGLTIGPNFPSVALRGFVEEVLLQTFPTCTASFQPSATPLAAAQLIATTAMQDHDVRIITTGPSTNLARALLLQPLLRPFVQNYAMTGAIVPAAGGIEPSEWRLLYDGTGELNAFIDPPALDVVIRGLGTRFWMVGRDATDYVPMSAAYAQRLQAEATTPEGQIVATIANNQIVQTALSAGLTAYWWDPLAALAGTGEQVVGFDTLSMRVVLAGASTGRTESAPIVLGGTTIHAGRTADRALFEQRFIDTLNP